MTNRDQLVVLRDFNIPGTSWSTDEKANVLLSSAHHDMSLSQVDNIRYSLGHSFALCFVTNLSKVASLTQPEDPDHPALEVSTDTGAVLVEKSEKSNKRLHCFRKADFWRINFFISGFDWSDLYSSQNMDDATNIFNSTVNSFFNSYYTIHPSDSNTAHWFSKELTHLRNKESRPYRKYKDTGSQSIFLDT